MTAPANPSIAQTVHYVEASDGAGDAICRAGIITALGPVSGAVSLTVIQDGRTSAYDQVAFDDDDRSQNTWHWPAGECGN